MLNFAIISICLTCAAWPNYTVTKQVGTVFTLRQTRKNFIVVYSRSPQTLNLVISRSVVVWPSTAKKCTKIYNARAELLFFSLNPIVLLRSRCRRHSSFLNSLFVQREPRIVHVYLQLPTP